MAGRRSRPRHRPRRRRRTRPADHGPALAEARGGGRGGDRGGPRAEQNALDKFAPAFVAADLMRPLNIAVAWATLGAGPADGAQPAAAPAEPAPPIIDSWARGVVASEAAAAPADAAAGGRRRGVRGAAVVADVRAVRAVPDGPQAHQPGAGGRPGPAGRRGGGLGAWPSARGVRRSPARFSWPEAEDARPSERHRPGGAGGPGPPRRGGADVAAQLRARLTTRPRRGRPARRRRLRAAGALDKAPACRPRSVWSGPRPRARRARAAARGKAAARRLHVAAARRFFVGGLEPAAPAVGRLGLSRPAVGSPPRAP